MSTQWHPVATSAALGAVRTASGSKPVGSEHPVPTGGQRELKGCTGWRGGLQELFRPAKKRKSAPSQRLLVRPPPPPPLPPPRIAPGGPHWAVLTHSGCTSVPRLGPSRLALAGPWSSPWTLLLILGRIPYLWLFVFSALTRLYHREHWKRKTHTRC